MKKLFFLLTIFIVLLASCNKSDEKIDEQQIATDLSADLTNVELPLPEDLGNGATENVIFGKFLVNGTSFNHIYQKTAGVTCGGSACLPTSYMIARSIVYPTRTFSVQELNSIISAMGTVCGSGTGIGKCQTYAKTDIGSCNQSTVSTTNRETAKNYIKNNLENGFPIVSLVSIKGGTSTSSPNYISETKNYGHFVTIVGLELTVSGNGSKLFYIDPLDRTAIIRECSYTTFLNSCLAASSINLYNMIGIGCPQTTPIVNYYGTGVTNAPQLNLPTANSQNISIPIALSWQNMAAGSVYRIHISKSSSNWNSSNGFADNSDRIMNLNTSTYNSTTFGSIAPGTSEAAQFNTTYYWSVKSFVNGVSSSYSTPQSFKTANAVITTPVAINATNITSAGFQMNWNGQSPLSVGYYNTLISTNTSFTNTLPNWEQNVTYPSLTWNSLQANTWYYYKVRIVTPTGASQWSNTISVKTNP